MVLKLLGQKKGFFFDQPHYVEKIFKKYNYFDCKPTCTPHVSNVKLFKNTGESVRQIEYASIIDSLMYVTNCTTPDIVYVMGKLCIFVSRPGNEHWHAIDMVLR